MEKIGLRKHQLVKIKNHKIINDYKCNDCVQLQEATILVSQVIVKREDYNIIASKLNNPETSAKVYWPILKIFYNDTKVPVIPSLLTNNKLK